MKINIWILLLILNAFFITGCTTSPSTPQNQEIITTYSAPETYKLDSDTILILHKSVLNVLKNMYPDFNLVTTGRNSKDIFTITYKANSKTYTDTYRVLQNNQFSYSNPNLITNVKESFESYLVKYVEFNNTVAKDDYKVLKERLSQINCIIQDNVHSLSPATIKILNEQVSKKVKFKESTSKMEIFEKWLEGPNNTEQITNLHCEVPLLIGKYGLLKYKTKWHDYPTFSNLETTRGTYIFNGSKISSDVTLELTQIYYHAIPNKYELKDKNLTINVNNTTSSSNKLTYNDYENYQTITLTNTSNDTVTVHTLNAYCKDKISANLLQQHINIPPLGTITIKKRELLQSIIFDEQAYKAKNESTKYGFFIGYQTKGQQQSILKVIDYVPEPL